MSLPVMAIPMLVVIMISSVIKLDSNGNLQWSRRIGGGGNDYSTSITQAADGSYLITGFTLSFGQGGYDIYIVKLDANGNLQWTKTIGGLGDEQSFSIIQTNDGGFAIAGFTSSFGQGAQDVYLIKLDSNGYIQWTRTIGGPVTERGYDLVQTTNGEYVITGIRVMNTSDVLFIKLDANGNLKSCPNGCQISGGGVVGSGGTIASAPSGIGAGGSVSTGGSVSSGGVLTNICP